MPPLKLAAAHISHSYGGLAVLDDISFEVGAGEIVAIVGPSGCGKSTLLRILGGLEQPRNGAALLSGDMPAGTLNPLTFVFQDFALLPWASVAGNIEFVLRGKGLAPREVEAIVADVLARLNLSDFAGAFPKQLSGGMKQRVGIARALAVRPAVLLMDEPLSALDAQTRALLMDDLKRVMASAAFAGLYVTHNLEEAVLLATRVVVLSRRPGRIRAVFDIASPLAERRPGDAELTDLQMRIWDMMRDDAAAADREIADA
ncbi:MAG TPA: ABC transporter ATP-binding protein [Beijerinckiaceae bacterium]|nr:ABC transporter ATP-binding protein [Beijerinckiaceae bacterium]